MKIPLPSLRSVSINDSVQQFLLDFESQWDCGRPVELSDYVKELGDFASPELIGALAKIDLQRRWERGDSIEARTYLNMFPLLDADSDRAVSLIFEEFCLCDEAGERPNVEDFCERYPSWADSLRWQLNVHGALSCAQSMSDVSVKFPAPGERFSKFELDSILGKGGAACVFLATDRALGGRKFVLKVSPNRGAEPSILGKLDHRHIVSVHSVEVEPESGLRGLSMPYLPGPTLDQITLKLTSAPLPRTALELRRMILPGADSPNLLAPVWGDYPSREPYAYGVAWIVSKMAEALAHAHDQGILHRDVKPANVLLSIEKGPLLFDFNLAHAPNSAEEAEVAAKGGTLPYMAPEQLSAFLSPERWEHVGAGADIYSLGLVLREMLTGHSPDQRRRSRSSLPRALQDALDERALPSDPTHRLYPQIPPALAAIVDHCLAYRSADRYRNAADLAEDLQNFLLHRPTKHVKNSSIRARISDWLTHGQRGRKIALVCAIIGPLSILGVNYLSNARQLNAAYELFDAGQYDAAEQEFDILLRSHPDNLRIRIDRAYCLTELGREPEAELILREAVRNEKSLPILQALLEKHPQNLILRLSVASAHVYRRDYRTAIEQFEAIKSPGRPRLNGLLGIANARLSGGEYAELFDTTDRSITQAASDFRTHGKWAAPDVELLARFYKLETGLIESFLKEELFDQAKRGAERLTAQSTRLTTLLNDRPDCVTLGKLIAGLSEIYQARIPNSDSHQGNANASIRRAQEIARSISTEKPMNTSSKELLKSLHDWIQESGTDSI